MSQSTFDAIAQAQRDLIARCRKTMLEVRSPHQLDCRCPLCVLLDHVPQFDASELWMEHLYWQCVVATASTMTKVLGG